jgi:hypothetical protein
VCASVLMIPESYDSIFGRTKQETCGTADVLASSKNSGICSHLCYGHME